MGKATNQEDDAFSKRFEECVRELELAGFKQGLVQGLDKGVRVGRMIALHGQLMMRFGRLPEAADRRVLSASPDEIDDWLGKVLTAEKLDDVFKLPEPEPTAEPKKKAAKNNMH